MHEIKRLIMISSSLGKLICGGLFLGFSINCLSQIKPTGNVTLSCYVKGSAGKKILLGNKPKGATGVLYKAGYFDSCYSINDSFRFKFSLTEPAGYSIEIADKKGWCGFIPSPGEDIRMVGSIDSLYKSKITGGKEDSLFNILVSKLRPIEMKLGNQLPADSFKFYLNKIKEERYNFIRQNTSSFLAALEIEGDTFTKLDSLQRDTLRSLYFVLTSKAKEFYPAKTAYYNLFIAPQKLQPDNPIPNFHFVNYDGVAFDLYDYLKADKKKYHLIDFWATWCKPCIAQFPALKEILDKYSEKGFDIISYSLDVDKNKFEDYMNKQTMAWQSITDLQGDQSPVFKMFKLGTIPANFLIDSKGIIIAVDIKPDKLSKILEEKIL